MRWNPSSLEVMYAATVKDEDQRRLSFQTSLNYDSSWRTISEDARASTSIMASEVEAVNIDCARNPSERQEITPGTKDEIIMNMFASRVLVCL